MTALTAATFRPTVSRPTSAQRRKHRMSKRAKRFWSFFFASIS